MPDRKHFKTARPMAQLRQGRNDWYRIESLAGSDTATVHVYDEIGYFGVSASDFIGELHGITARNIDLRISSPGGSVFDGFAIFEALRSHPAKVTTYVDSLAASIASVIALAGDRVVIGKFAEFMVHEASGLCIGNSDDMQRMINDLDRESTRIASVYADRSGSSVEEWRERMKAETWFSAEEAVAAGLADEVAVPVHESANEPETAMAARWDLSVFRYAGREDAPAPTAAAPRQPAPEGTAPTTVKVDLAAGGDFDAQLLAWLRRNVQAIAEEATAASDSTPVTVTAGQPRPAKDPAPEPTSEATEPAPAPETAAQPDDKAPDGWADQTAHLHTEGSPEGWAQLVANLDNDPSPAPSHGAATA